MPPGPPVLSTLVAEIYGPELDGPDRAGAAGARGLRDDRRRRRRRLVGRGRPRPQLDLEVDREKAARAGVAPEAVARTLRVALAGAEAGLLHDDASARAGAAGRCGSTRAQRSTRRRPAGDPACTAPSGRLVPLSRAGAAASRRRASASSTTRTCSRSSTSSATSPAREESPVYAHPRHGRADRRARATRRAGRSSILSTAHARATRTGYAMKWDGEWQITYEVFRDLGIAFARRAGADLRPGRRLVPVVRRRRWSSWSPIPLTLVGILPAHAAGRRLLHRHLDDRLHRPGRDHRAQLDPAGRLHQPGAAGRRAARGGGGRGRRGALPADRC